MMNEVVQCINTDIFTSNKTNITAGNSLTFKILLRYLKTQFINQKHMKRQYTPCK